MNDRTEWLEQRKKGVGGSDCAAACGQSRYLTAYELWLNKTGRTPIEREDNEAIRFGRAMEAIAADMFAQRKGVKLRRRNPILQHPKFPFMRASIDRQIEGQRAGFEAKNVNSDYYKFSGEWGPEGSDEVPIEHLLQTQHYLCVTGYDVWHLGAVVGGNSLKCYVIEPDRELHEMIVEAEAKFWTYVEIDEPPEFDFQHKHAVEMLRRLHPGTNGETVALDPALLDWHNVRLQADEEIKRYEAVSNGARAHILHALGDAAAGRLANGGLYKRKVIHRPAYSVDACDYTTLTYSKPKAASAKEQSENDE